MQKLFFVFIVGLFLSCIAARVPGMYDDLWEDEVHYNYVAFSCVCYGENRFPRPTCKKSSPRDRSIMGGGILRRV